MDCLETIQENKKIVCGILAHVDAGKTTLAESMLYLSGQIKKQGRVDHGDAFLDNFVQERERGITIFSKQARILWKNLELILLDTPGHVDFSAEMERTLQVLDYAILVVNGSDGVQGHTYTLWKLLERYDIPVFLFVNKMDLPDTDRDSILAQLNRQLDDRIVDFLKTDLEEIATRDEQLCEAYLKTGGLSTEELAQAVAERRIFPCFFGAALRGEGVESLLEGLGKYTLQPEYPQEFGARVYKIARDENGARLTYLKVTGGVLRVKMLVDNRLSAGEAQEIFEEKIDQLRIYNGAGYTLREQVQAGEICAVTGLSATFTGQGLGYETENERPVLEPVLTYRMEFVNGEDPAKVLGLLRQLEEEEPLLHILWKEDSRELHAQVMGEVQMEVLQKVIRDRFHLEVKFGDGSIMYKETISAPVLGIGHFEPLRHYAEVELLLEPGEPGSGLQFASLCSEDLLDKNWQRLVLSHLEERSHPGVLTGAAITDMRIMLVAGRAHIKHTEGGDFRQATYRALRQGLRMALEQNQAVLLEPVFSFRLGLPQEYVGRAMSDIQRMYGTFGTPENEGDRAVLTGRAPVATMRDYQREVNAYTHGHGHLSCIPDGYEPCHNAQEVILAKNYQPEADPEHPTGSVFCAHGAGFLVEWDQVPAYAHVEIPAKIRQFLQDITEQAETMQTGAMQAGTVQAGMLQAGTMQAATGSGGAGRNRRGYQEPVITQEEIDAIFKQTYGGHEQDKKRHRRYHISRRKAYEDSRPSGYRPGQGAGKKTDKEECLLVDGYNIIFAWEELRALSEVNIDSARDRLMDICCNYQGTMGGTLILVFDAYKVKGNPGSVMQYHNIHVVYTKEAETADQYIEKTVHQMADRYQITVATSDRLEQMIIWGAGALRLSATGFREVVDEAARKLREEYTEKDSRIAFHPFL